MNPQVQREGLVHTPDRGGWEAHMGPLHDSLAPAAPATGADSLSQHVDANAARQVRVEHKRFCVGGAGCGGAQDTMSVSRRGCSQLDMPQQRGRYMT